MTQLITMECMLLDQNEGMSGTYPNEWFNVGIVPHISKTQNLWCRVTSGAIHGAIYYSSVGGGDVYGSGGGGGAGPPMTPKG